MRNKFFSPVIILTLMLFLPHAFGAAFPPVKNQKKMMTSSQKQAEQKLIQQLIDTAPENQNYVQIGDMRFKKSVLKKDGFYGNRWTDGKVYYQFDANVSAANQQVWKDAVALWEAATTNLTFTESTGSGNYIHVKNDSSNWSYIGMQGGMQEIGIFNWGYPIIVAHEICHALSGIHEQSRSDRDSYVTINWDNINPIFDYNFSIQPLSTIYGAYDYESCMHYTRDDFSKDGSDTITTTDPAFQSIIGQRTKLSDLDKSGMASRYSGGATGSITVTYPSGGESLSIGKSYDVTWTSSGVTGKVDFLVYKGGSVYGQTITTENTGTYSWDTTGLPVATDYQIAIASSNDPGSVNNMGNNFTLSTSGSGGTYNVTIGSLFDIDSSDVTEIASGNFEKRPKTYIYVGTKKKSVKIQKTSYPTATVICLWKQKVSPGQYKLITVPKAKGTKYSENTVSEDFNVMAPEIDASNSSATIADTITNKKGTFYTINLYLVGNYFGTKKPKIVYVDDNDGKKRKFKVTTKNPMLGGERTGISILDAIGKKIPANSSGVITLTNKIGSDTYTLDTSKLKFPNPLKKIR